MTDSVIVDRFPDESLLTKKVISVRVEDLPRIREAVDALTTSRRGGQRDPRISERSLEREPRAPVLLAAGSRGRN